MAWRVAKSLLKLRDQINVAHPNRSKLSDGTIGDAAHATTDSDHNPWVKDGAMGVVTALDITHDPDDGCDCEKIVNALVKSRDKRIKYLIWNGRIVSSTVQPWVWRPYAGSNPHNKHFHLSVSPMKVLYDSEAAWDISVAPPVPKIKYEMWAWVNGKQKLIDESIAVPQDKSVERAASFMARVGPRYAFYLARGQRPSTRKVTVT